MNKPLVIFGTGDIAQLAHYYFTNDSGLEPAAFTVDRDYITDRQFCGLPVVQFEELAAAYPPADYQLFIALSYSKLNMIRKEKYLAAKKLGYDFASYVSSHATVLNDGRIGENCFIFEDNTIQPFVTIGNNVTIWSGGFIGHHSTIHDHNFISGHVAISGHVVIEEACFLGVNSTLRDNITIGESCIIGAGTLILRDTEPHGLYKGRAADRSKRPSNKLKKI